MTAFAKTIVSPKPNQIRLFAGSARAGKRAAVRQTLLATAKANDFNPYEWLLDVLNKLPTHPNHKLDELLPLRRQLL